MKENTIKAALAAALGARCAYGIQLLVPVLVLLVVPIQMGLEWCFDRCTTALDRRRERLAKRRRAPRRPRPAHRSRRRR